MRLGMAACLAHLGCTLQTKSKSNHNAHTITPLCTISTGNNKPPVRCTTPYVQHKRNDFSKGPLDKHGILVLQYALKGMNSCQGLAHGLSHPMHTHASKSGNWRKSGR